MSAPARPVGAVPLTRPRALRAGDRVAVVAPSGPLQRDRLEAGLGFLRDWGLEPVTARHALDRHPVFDYLAGTDEARARDLQSAWCDPSVAAVLCARGGYGAQRIVDLLDWPAMRAAGPKAFAGFSDVTALHEAYATRLGLATLHGPMPAAASFVEDEPSREQLRRALFEPDVPRVLTSPEARTLVPGRASGVTLGGCLSLLAAELGTPHARPGAGGGILLLEDIGDRPYALDRMLTQLLRSGWLDAVAGIALGSWKDCGPYEEVRSVLLDRLGPLGVPIVEQLGFGHCASTVTVPLGVPAVLDADARTLTVNTTLDTIADTTGI